MRREVKKWAEHIMITEWRFLTLENEEGKFAVLLVGTLPTISGPIEIYIADAFFPSVSALLPSNEIVSLGRYLPGTWPWRKLREIKYRDKLFAEIAAARMFTGSFSQQSNYNEEGFPDLPFMNFYGDDEFLN